MSMLENGEKSKDMSWDIRIKEFIDVVSKDTLKPAELIAALITKYFPENEIDIFTQLLERSQFILKRDEVEKELGQIMVEEIKQNLVRCQGASSSKQSECLTNLIKQCDTFYDSLTTATGKNKDNELSYDNELREKVEGYKKYFIEIYSTWEIWRNASIEIMTDMNIPHHSYYDLRSPNKLYNKVYDTFLGKAVTYANTEYNLDAIARYKGLCDRVKSRYFNEANGEFMKMYLYTFALDKFLPNNSKAPTIAPNRKIGTIVYGIYGKDTFPDGGHGPEDHSEFHLMSNDKSDVITGINIHCGYFLDCLKVKYKNQIGTAIGNEKGGNAYTIRGLDEKDNYVVGANVYFREHVSDIQFFLSDGQKTDVF
ncbi:13813_t:CDS:2 [Racocetra persica]|uniref:13813_t:CDS:1 n=1 Tax=Racocetra persica TaxID=160502 RepID=A0ACA9KQ07_9GLOM|nr:13813_t:CDS:2 [Racocetra persica]